MHYAFFYITKDGAMRVDLPSALYLDTPYTIQPGGCGDPGEYTHVTPGFLENLDGTTTDVFGAPGNKIKTDSTMFEKYYKNQVCY